MENNTNSSNFPKYLWKAGEIPPYLDGSLRRKEISEKREEMKKNNSTCLFMTVKSADQETTFRVTSSHNSPRPLGTIIVACVHLLQLASPDIRMRGAEREEGSD